MFDLAGPLTLTLDKITPPQNNAFEAFFFCCLLNHIFELFGSKACCSTW